MVETLEAFIAEKTGASKIARTERIQSLWSGYGEILRVHLGGASVETLIVKWVRPPASGSLARSISHRRKCRSYDVETTFYRTYAARCDDACRVPRLLGERTGDDEWVLLLEDLDREGFSNRRRAPLGAELEACLSWLASFHARFLGANPNGLWQTGTYWHLDTRREELAAIEDASLRARAPELDRLLTGARFQTFVHGDAKPANFCFSGSSARVAAVDFQYVGGGPGIKDVAYLLHGGSSRVAEDRALSFYFSRLRKALPLHVDAASLEAEWSDLYGAARDDFDRFLAGWRG